MLTPYFDPLNLGNKVKYKYTYMPKVPGGNIDQRIEGNCAYNYNSKI